MARSRHTTRSASCPGCATSTTGWACSARRHSTGFPATPRRRPRQRVQQAICWHAASWPDLKSDERFLRNRLTRRPGMPIWIGYWLKKWAFGKPSTCRGPEMVLRGSRPEPVLRKFPALAVSIFLPSYFSQMYSIQHLKETAGDIVAKIDPADCERCVAELRGRPRAAGGGFSSWESAAARPTRHMP